MTDTLYKYREVNEFTEDIIKNNRFWYSPLQELNDPNEGMIREITEREFKKFTEKTKDSQMLGFVTGMFFASKNNSQFYGLNKSELNKLQKKIRNKPSRDRKYKFIKNFIKEKTGKEISDPNLFVASIDSYLKNIGILSLSEDPINQLMWSHYAKNHSGIAIGISSFKEDDYKKVSYTTNYDVDGIDLEKHIAVVKIYAHKSTHEISPSDSNLQKLISTKTVDWEYEREWRGVEEKYGLHDIKGEISEIIFGLRCRQNERDKVRMLVLESGKCNVKFKEIYRNPNSYKLLVRDC